MPNQGDEVKLWDMPENTGNAELSASELSAIMPGTIQFEGSIYDPNDLGVPSALYSNFPSVATLNANFIFFNLFYLYESATFDAITANNLNTGGTGGFHGIYDINITTGLPGNRLAQTDLFDTTVAGIKTVNFRNAETFEFDARWYWSAYAGDAGIQFRAYIFNSGHPIGFDNTTTPGALTPVTGLFIPITPAFTELPAVAPTSGYTQGVGPVMMSSWHKAP